MPQYQPYPPREAHLPTISGHQRVDVNAEVVVLGFETPSTFLPALVSTGSNTAVRASTPSRSLRAEWIAWSSSSRSGPWCLGRHEIGTVSQKVRVPYFAGSRNAAAQRKSANAAGPTNNRCGNVTVYDRRARCGPGARTNAEKKLVYALPRCWDRADCLARCHLSSIAMVSFNCS